MHREKTPPGDVAGRIRHQPVERCRHHCRLDHLGAIVAGLDGEHTCIGDPPGTNTLTVTPLPARSLAMIAENASKAAFDGPYVGEPSRIIVPRLVVTLTMRPHFWRIMSWTRARDSAIVAHGTGTYASPSAVLASHTGGAAARR
jgi:hypothetical protein